MRNNLDQVTNTMTHARCLQHTEPVRNVLIVGCKCSQRSCSAVLNSSKLRCIFPWHVLSCKRPNHCPVSKIMKEDLFCVSLQTPIYERASKAIVQVSDKITVKSKTYHVSFIWFSSAGIDSTQFHFECWLDKQRQHPSRTWWLLKQWRGQNNPLTHMTKPLITASQLEKHIGLLESRRCKQ